MSLDTILLTGAGASYGARPDENRRPPLGAALPGYLLNWFDANSPSAGDHHWESAMANWWDSHSPPKALFDRRPNVRAVLVEAVDRAAASDTAFEEVMLELLREQRREMLDRVNEVLASALLCGRACAFNEHVDLYDRLFNALAGRLRGIITPNYDLLAEQALGRLKMPFYYRAMNEPQNGVVLDKFHGSANWFQPSGAAAGADFEIVRSHVKPLKAVEQVHGLSFFNDHPVYAPPQSSRSNTVFELKRGGMALVLVTYGPGKDAMHGRPHLDRVREECIADLKSNPPRRVIAVGVSPPRGGGDDDAWENLCQTLGSLKSAKDYWSRSAVEREKMAAYGFQGKDGWFAEMVEVLESEAA